jgi:hypothetical protein
MNFFRESLRLQLIRELPELVEIDTRFEPKGMGNRLRRGMASGRGGLADARADCSIHSFPKGNAELARALFQQSGEIIIECQSRAHSGIDNVSNPDVKTSTPG